MNPPYQKSDGGAEDHAVPIYHKFIEKVIDEIKPDYLVSINPSRWMVGGRGLDAFRKRMIADRRIKKIVHFPGEKEIFTEVSIKGGVNYFLWNKNHNGKCVFNGVERALDEFDIVMQDNQSMSILKKVFLKTENWIGNKCETQDIFGVRSFFSNWKEEGIVCYARGKKSHYISVTDFTNNLIIDKWKVATSKATVEGASFNGDVRTYISGGFVVEPNAICTETYLVVNVFDTKKNADNFIVYMKTKFFRFMLGLRCLTQNISKDKFLWVPDIQDYSRSWTDEQLYDKFDLDQKERAYIEKKIKPIVEKK